MKKETQEVKSMRNKTCRLIWEIECLMDVYCLILDTTNLASRSSTESVPSSSLLCLNLIPCVFAAPIVNTFFSPPQFGYHTKETLSLSISFSLSHAFALPSLRFLLSYLCLKQPNSWKMMRKQFNFRFSFWLFKVWNPHLPRSLCFPNTLIVWVVFFFFSLHTGFLPMLDFHMDCYCAIGSVETSVI